MDINTAFLIFFGMMFVGISAVVLPEILRKKNKHETPPQEVKMGELI